MQALLMQMLDDEWRKLPDDLVEHILRRLHVYDIVRAKCTCRRFKTLISSKKFIGNTQSVSYPSLLLRSEDFEHHSASEIVYDPNQNTWIKLSMTFLQEQIPSFSYRLASSGGLLCFGSGVEFVVCNPITRSWRKIPRVPNLLCAEDDGEAFEISLGEDSVQAFGFWATSSGSDNFYNVIILDHFASGVGNCRSISYCSELCKWKVGRSLNITEPCSIASPSLVVCQQSCFYSLWKKGSEFVIYQLFNGKWDMIEAPDCNNSLLQSLHMMERRGVLHLIGGVGSVWVGTDLHLRPTSVRIWKLDVETKLWLEVTRMPREILNDFQKFIEFDRLNCLGKDDILYIKSPQSYILMYNFSTKIWSWLDTDVEDATAVIFEPSLSAIA